MKAMLLPFGIAPIYRAPIPPPSQILPVPKPFFTQSADGLTVGKSLPCGMELDYAYDVDSEYKFKYIREMTEKSPGGLERITIREKSYEDTDINGATDLITESVAVNSKTTTFVHNTLAAQKTIASPEGRTVTSVYDPGHLAHTKHQYSRSL